MKTIINIDVPDLDRAIAFYGSALGLRLNRRIDEDVAELTGASSVIYLLRNPPGSAPVSGAPLVRHYARHWTPVHIDFAVRDIVEAAARAVAAGAVQESESVEWHGSKCITLSDPFGHGFCLISFDSATYTDSADD